jgi:hypothetical protein
MIRYVLLLIFPVAFFSCEEPYQLDLEQTPPTVVIEGLVTNRSSMQSVRITRTAAFYQGGPTPRITDATVRVSDNLGNIFNFVHNPRGHADSAGYYVPEFPFNGIIGRTYSLHVQTEGNVYEASDKLASVINMDSLAVRIDKDEEEEPEEEGRFYEVLLFAREPQNEENFYLFKFFRNDTLSFANDTDIYYSNDELLAENIDGIPAPIHYKTGELARVEAYSISRQGYVYYNDLWSLLNNDSGGMFGPVPSSPRTNLTNGALGFFQVSAVNSKAIKVE